MYKFKGFGVFVFSDIESKQTYVEIWSSSTKHPDSIYELSEYGDSLENVYGWNDESSKEQDFQQWLLWIASRTMFKSTMRELVEIAMM